LPAGGEGRAGGEAGGLRRFLGERDKPTGLDEDRKKGHEERLRFSGGGP